VRGVEHVVICLSVKSNLHCNVVYLT